ncbi:MAG: hypothetical protein IKO55_15475 [Kiritimatiellae bacterium]|nr:hypothetical protein [Kiritimatiellia bacterium]
MKRAFLPILALVLAAPLAGAMIHVFPSRNRLDFALQHYDAATNYIEQGMFQEAESQIGQGIYYATNCLHVLERNRKVQEIVDQVQNIRDHYEEDWTNALVQALAVERPIRDFLETEPFLKMSVEKYHAYRFFDYLPKIQAALATNNKNDGQARLRQFQRSISDIITHSDDYTPFEDDLRAVLTRLERARDDVWKLKQKAALAPESTPAHDLSEALVRYSVITNALANENERVVLLNLPAAKNLIRNRLDEMGRLHVLAAPFARIVANCGFVSHSAAVTNFPPALANLKEIDDCLILIRLRNSDGSSDKVSSDLDACFRLMLQSVQWATNDIAKGDASALAFDARFLSDMIDERFETMRQIEALEEDFRQVLSDLEGVEREVLVRRIRRDYAEAQDKLRADDFDGGRYALANLAGTLRLVHDEEIDGFLEQIADALQTIEEILEEKRASAD